MQGKAKECYEETVKLCISDSNPAKGNQKQVVP